MPTFCIGQEGSNRARVKQYYPHFALGIKGRENVKALLLVIQHILAELEIKTRSMDSGFILVTSPESACKPLNR